MEKLKIFLCLFFATFCYAEFSAAPYDGTGVAHIEVATITMATGGSITTENEAVYMSSNVQILGHLVLFDEMVSTHPAVALLINHGVGTIENGLGFGDGNSGIYLAALNVLNIQTGGVNAFSFRPTHISANLSIFPTATGVKDLGATSLRFRNLYTATFSDNGSSITATGNAQIDGNLNVNGVITSSKSYATIRSSSVIVTSVGGGSQNFTAILGNWEDVFLSNFSRNGSTLTYSGGVKKYSYVASMTVSCDATEQVHFRIMLNGVTIGGTEQHRKFPANDIGFAGTLGGLELTAGDTICLALSSDSAANVSVEHIYIILVEMD